MNALAAPLGARFLKRSKRAAFGRVVTATSHVGPHTLGYSETSINAECGRPDQEQDSE
jgi:hypothetical protein